ncbi:MAG TPA: RNA polymerase sigma factor, partial [Terriglobales bacterium]|nr:RNA polymerase sigma factor [Terriglobales bacterium]
VTFPTMLSFHLRKGRKISRRAEQQAMATAHIGIPGQSGLTSVKAGADAHRAMTNTLPDEDLMLQVREGVGEMLAVLFDRYQSPLFNFYRRLTGDRAVSEDLVQDVFFRILKYRQSYKPGTPFRAWMYQIARNARLDHVRKHPEALEFEPEMSPAVSPNDSAESEQQSALLHRALLMLADDKREVLVLSRFQELKYEEIARMLDCEVGTVKVRIHRALRELRTIFEKLSSAKVIPSAGGEKGNLQ